MEHSQDGRVEFIVVGLVILVVILILFGKKKKPSNSFSESSDRMLEKYDLLINQLLQGHKESKIFEKKENRIKFGVSNSGGRTIFEFIEVGTSLTIIYEGTGVGMGTIENRWSFNTNQNPEEILQKMNTDIGALIMRKYQQ